MITYRATRTRALQPTAEAQKFFACLTALYAVRQAKKVRVMRPGCLDATTRATLTSAPQSPRAPCSRASSPDLLLGTRHERPGARLPSGDPS